MPPAWVLAFSVAGYACIQALLDSASSLLSAAFSNTYSEYVLLASFDEEVEGKKGEVLKLVPSPDTIFPE